LTPAERAIGLAFRRMLKENTYWLIMNIRYRDQANWEVWRGALRSMLVPPGAPPEAAEQGGLIADGIRKTVLEQMQAHGMGRHTDEEVHQIGSADLIALSDFLADKPFFFGDKPTGTDATVYAYLANIIELPFDSPSTRVARGRSNLVEYCRRMRARFYEG
jgi:glutathione S-transferase